MVNDFKRVASLDDLPDETPVAADLENGDSVCLVTVRGEVYAFENRCTHAEFPMSDGDMIEEYVIECGLHGAQFDVRSGEVLELPATENLPCYEVRVENGQVLVRVRPASEG
jgi:3-phenylpropionate/trans-cinnamate dioxygenase ferredoxin subunit